MRVAVVGAGAGGLAAAHRLSALGHECDVYERRPYLGGQASTIDLGGYRIERCPQYMRRDDGHARALLEEIGLAAQLDWRASSSAVFAGASLRARAVSLLTRRRGADVLGYPRSSWEVLWGRLAELIEEAGGRILIDRPVTRVARDGDGFLVSAPDARRYDAVIATVAGELLAEILDPQLAAACRAPRAPGEYRAATSLLLELDRPLTSRHRTRIAEPGAPFAVIVEQTNFIEPEHYGGRHFAYVVGHLSREDPLLELDADALLERYEPGLRRLSPGFSAQRIRDRWLFCEPHAEIVGATEHAGATAPAESGVPDLLLAGAAQAGPSGASIDRTIALAAETTAALGRAGEPA